MENGNYFKENTTFENEKEKLIEVPNKDRICRIQWQVFKVFFFIIFTTISKIITQLR
jgi:hypothetical protein